LRSTPSLSALPFTPIPAIADVAFFALISCGGSRRYGGPT
jgi:hypothetical protein